jgi:hypothetical protein
MTAVRNKRQLPPGGIWVLTPHGWRYVRPPSASPAYEPEPIPPGSFPHPHHRRRRHRRRHRAFHYIRRRFR